MALLVLVSTLSVTIEKHFCGDFLVDVSVFSEAQKCGAEISDKEKIAITKKPCCKDTIDLLEGQDELQISTNIDLEFDQQVFVASFLGSYIQLFEVEFEQLIPFQNYSPPDLVYDRHIVHEVFLI